MRILHTSDWHLNDRLGKVDRQADIIDRLKEIANYLKEYAVDTMVVSGDIFNKYTRIEDIRDAIKEVSNIFNPFLVAGGTILVISGNHDKNALFNLMDLSMELAIPLKNSKKEPFSNGRLYLVIVPTYLFLKDKEEQIVQFVLIPYPTASSYKIKCKTLEEKNKLLREKMLEKLDQIDKENIDPTLPKVLVTHLNIRGTQTHNLYRITENEDVVFDSTDIPNSWDYVACGHIHKPQIISNNPYIRYAGSIERMDYGEKDDEKSVVFLEIKDRNKRSEPILLPLNSTPIYHIEIKDPDKEIPDLKLKYSDHNYALVKYTLHYKSNICKRKDKYQYCKDIEAIFSRWYDRCIVYDGMQVNRNTIAGKDFRNNIEGTVMFYIENQIFSSQEEKNDILKLAKELIVEFIDKEQQ